MYDLIIRDGLIIDGGGGPAFKGDLAIKGDRIEAVGAVAGRYRKELDAKGAVVAPGFIDVHTHDDRIVLADPSVLAKVSQGVTTVVTGNCGISLAPYTRDGSPPAPLTLLGGTSEFVYRDFAAYLAAVAKSPPAVNVVPFVGHTSLRACAISDLSKPAGEAELNAMADLLDEAMTAGAVGMTTGLYYPPASAALASELELLLKRVGEQGGMTTSHIRDEGDGLIESLREALTTAKAAGVPLVISHLKCASPGVWGRAAKVLALLDDAAKHQEVVFDVYPYEASSTMLRPDRLRDATRVVVSWSEPHPDAAGRDLDEIAACWCCSPEQAARTLSPGGAIYYKMQENDVRRILSHPRSMIGSDGLPHDVHPHPRLWGTFPRVLGHYVRELKLIPLEEAVRKMTSLPSKVFGLAGRGTLAPGGFADVVVLDAGVVIDRATYDHPKREALGVSAVLVNGEVVWDGTAASGRRPGRVLRRAA